MGECAFLANQLSIKLKIPHINTLMGQELNDTNRYLRFINIKWLKTVALTDKQADTFNNRFRKRVDKIIPWGIRDNEKIINQDRNIDILGTGSLIAGKNFELFIDIVNSIKKYFPYINAIIIGDGIEKEKLNKLISLYKLDNNLKLSGSLQRNEVLELMAKSKIFLHTSNYESFGFVLSEALASGCYVVCSNTGFAHNTKKMFVANEKNDFINIILNLLNKNFDFMPEVEFSASDTSIMYKNLYDKTF
jgi:glycosyltransferase involved in cell wall biosynthesis